MTGENDYMACEQMRAAAIAQNHTEGVRGQYGTRPPAQKHKRSAGGSPACARCCSHAVSEVVDMEVFAAPIPWLQGPGEWTPSAAAMPDVSTLLC